MLGPREEESTSGSGREASSADDEEECASMESAQRPMNFTLNGLTWTFENHRALVLAAARQLGMAIGRDARFLWIADEALLDEYDEEQAAALESVPETPLSEDVARHYSDIFVQRSKPLRVQAGTTSEEAAAAKAAIAATNGSPSRTRTKRERRRKRLALRDARLSGITERYTEELAVLEDVSPSSAPAPVSEDAPFSPQSPKPAQWPSPLPIDMLVPPAARMSGALPRIDSASMGLDQLDKLGLEEQSDVPAAAPLSPQVEIVQPPSPHDETASSSATQPITLPASAEERAPAETSLAQASMAQVRAAGNEREVAGSPGAAARPFAVGDRVEVDFDDEGWFGGIVLSVHEQGGVLVYSVRLDDGETADDVEGSEIRAPAGQRAPELRGDGESGSNSGSRDANTRSDALSGFDRMHEVQSELSLEDELVRVPQPAMECRLEGSGVAWSFIDETEHLGWSPPTASLLKALDNRCRSPP